jgi:hypothetical protein
VAGRWFPSRRRATFRSGSFRDEVGMRMAFQGMVVVAAVAAGHTAAIGQTGQFAGVDSVRVVVGSLGNAAPAGLTQDTIRSQVVAWLSGAGIAIDTAEASLAPGLAAGFSIRELPGGWIVGVRVELVEPSVSVREYAREKARLGDDAPRDAAEVEAALWSLRRNATTWSRHAVATAPTERGYEGAITVLQQLVTELINAIAADNESR